MSDPASRFVVGISCGHGGRHSKACPGGGKCNACGTKAAPSLGTEADYVRALGDCLTALAPSQLIEPVALNQPGEAAAHSLRASRAVANGAGLVVELHLNESNSPTTHGAHVFHRPTDETGRLCARAMAECWPTGLRRQLLPSYRGDRYTAGMVEPANPKYWRRVCTVLGAYDPTPAVLVEVGYASCESDVEALASPWVQAEMVAAMHRGILAAARAAQTG